MAEHFLILVADDDPALASLLREILADEGYGTTCCFSGEQVLRTIKADVPHLAILDLQMEHESAGLAVLEQLRRSDELRHMPVILYSAAVPRLAALKPTLESLDCVSLPKPFNIDDLLRLVETLLRPANGGALRERQFGSS